jgi:hypothetical protein
VPGTPAHNAQAEQTSAGQVRDDNAVSVQRRSQQHRDKFGWSDEESQSSQTFETGANGQKPCEPNGRIHDSDDSPTTQVRSSVPLL